MQNIFKDDFMDNFDRKYKTKKVTIFGQNHRLITSFENIFTNNTKWTKKVNLRPKPWINPFEKIQFFDFTTPIFLQSRNACFLCRTNSKTILQTVLGGNLTTKKSLFDILDKKECFLDRKSKVRKKTKNSKICKGVSQWFLSKNRPFSHV